MKRPLAHALCLLLAGAPSAFAAEVVVERADHRAGQVFGGLGGVMLGAVAGGPFGALAGAALGAWGGSAAQQGAGLSETAYRVKTETGDERVVRSPTQRFQPGDRVSISGNRLARSVH
ncbi:hypothetical protein D9M68_745680 [compost metagenome]